jgi:hypothetical protein
MSKVLTQLGLPCTHERIVNIYWVAEGPVRFAKLVGGSGDSSHLAAPLLAELPQQTLVLHQVREPVAVIRSHMGIRFFARPHEPSIYLADRHEDIVRFIGEHCPSCVEGEDELTRCIRYWTDWNRLVERTSDAAGLEYLRYRLEDIDEDLLQEILRRLGAEVSRSQITATLAEVSRSTNTRLRDPSVDWSELPPSAAREDLVRLAAHYGYPTG